MINIDDSDYTPEGCTCSYPFKSVSETGSNGGSIRYCYRPYTEEELNKKNAGQCERYINQCSKINQISCRNIFSYCDKNNAITIDDIINL